MVAPARCLGSSTAVTRLDVRNRHKRSAATMLVIRNVASGSPAPAAAKRLGIALGVAASGAAGLAVTAVAAGQGVDVLQTLLHVPQDIWGVYQASLVTHPLQTKVRIGPAFRPTCLLRAACPELGWASSATPSLQSP